MHARGEAEFVDSLVGRPTEPDLLVLVAQQRGASVLAEGAVGDQYRPRPLSGLWIEARHGQQPAVSDEGSVGEQRNSGGSESDLGQVHVRRALRKGLALSCDLHLGERVGGNVEASEQDAFARVQSVGGEMAARILAPIPASAFGGDPESPALGVGANGRPRLVVRAVGQPAFDHLAVRRDAREKQVELIAPR